jgi:hypothetical protein
MAADQRLYSVVPVGGGVWPVSIRTPKRPDYAATRRYGYIMSSAVKQSP